MKTAQMMSVLVVAVAVGVLALGSTAFAGNDIEVKASDGLVVITGTVDNVKVEDGGRVHIDGATIKGNVQADGAFRVEVRFGTTVEGDVQIKKTTYVRVVDSTIEGDIQIEENGTGGVPININRNEVGGNVQVSKNEASEIRIKNNRIDGDLQVKENDATLVIGQNIVDGDTEIED